MKILFFTLHLQRTGSEVALYNILNHSALLREHTVGVASRDRGVLFDGLPDRFQVWHAKEYYGKKVSMLTRVKDFVRRAVRKDGYKEFHEAVHETFRPDLWYINTLAQPHLLEYARLHQIPCVLHSHETNLIVYALSGPDVANIVQTPKLILACSSVAAQMLHDLGRSNAVEVCYPAVNVKEVKGGSTDVGQLRARWGIRENAFVWLMAGYYCDNKNPLRFMEIARQLLDRHPNAHFVWVGGDNQSGAGVYLQNVARRMGLEHAVTLTGHVGEAYYDFLRATDGVLLTSNRESLSLVTAEAIMLGKPVVAFDCGGVREIVEDGTAGVILDSWNTADAVATMTAIMQNPLPDHTHRSGGVERKFDLARQVERWDTIMQQHLVSHEKN